MYGEAATLTCLSCCYTLAADAATVQLHFFICDLRRLPTPMDVPFRLACRKRWRHSNQKMGSVAQWIEQPQTE